MDLFFPDKDPDETLDYSVDWTSWLDGDSIATSTWIIPVGITKNSDTSTGTGTTIWLSGGTTGQTYRITNRVLTVGGRTSDQSLVVRMVDK
jgi:hypothetical protein